MSAPHRWLIVFYALVAVAALIATWGQNIAYFAQHGDVAGPFGAFIEDTRANPASRSITVDIGFFLLAAAAFMIIEARRLGVAFVWLYLIASFLIAVSVAFPLFMIARELRLAKQTAPEASWRLGPVDFLGLGVVAILVLAVSYRILM